MFDRSRPAAGVAACISPCCSAKREDDHLGAATQARVESLTGHAEPATGLLRTDDSPNLISADASPCQKQALTLGPTLRRFNRYRQALPAARAADDMNRRLGASEADKDKPVDAACLTRLPTDAQELNKSLGLPPNTIKPEQLRQEDTGFRAALYRDEATGRVILVPRDTQPTSLVDWQTNTRNGDGLDTDQYKAARVLSTKLTQNGVDFDVAGYSKGGGIAQEMALLNPNANAFVFNSAGLHENSLSRTGNTDFASLSKRTQAFSAQGDFLTYMNSTTDPAQQIANAQFLRREVTGENRKLVDPMQIDHRNPSLSDGAKDDDFQAARDDYLSELDAFGRRLEQDFASGKALRSFPPVRAGQQEVIANSDTFIGNRLGAKDAGPNLGKLYQHKMGNVLESMHTKVNADRKTLERFLDHCR